MQRFVLYHCVFNLELFKNVHKSFCDPFQVHDKTFSNSSINGIFVLILYLHGSRFRHGYGFPWQDFLQNTY